MIRCGVEEPLVSERVLQLADSPVWLILEGLEHRRSGRNRPFEERVNVVHVDVDDDGCSPEGLRTLVVRREFVGKHHMCTFDFDLRVSDLSLPGYPLRNLLCSECFCVERKCTLSITDSQGWHRPILDHARERRYGGAGRI